jgi:hypothetical protein
MFPTVNPADQHFEHHLQRRSCQPLAEVTSLVGGAVIGRNVKQLRLFD